MRYLKPSILMVVLGSALAACGDIVSPRDAAGGVTVEMRGEALVVRNQLPAPICYIPIEQQYAAAVLLAMSVDAESCSQIAARSTLAIPLAEIWGWNAEARNVIFHWWVFAPADYDGVFAGSIHTLVTGR
jgi:hypothetical protein